MPKNSLDVGSKADVQHPVRFIQHDALQPRHIEIAPAHVVEHPPGSPDHDIGAALQLIDLRRHWLAAVETNDFDFLAGSQFGQLGGNLPRQLAGRRQNQGLGLDEAQIDPLQDRNPERGCLTRPRLGLPHQVMILQRQGDHRRLNRRGLGKTNGRKRPEHRLGKAHPLKIKLLFPCRNQIQTIPILLLLTRRAEAAGGRPLNSNRH